MIKSMAGAILSSVLSMINGFRLQSPSLHPCKAIDENLNKLEAVIVRLQALVSNVEKKGMQDECVKHWLQELKHTAYDAEDMLEDYEYEVQQRSMVCGSTQFPFLDGIVSRMHDIVERFHLIECQLNNLDNTIMPSVEELGIYGRDEDKKRVIELILENSKRELCVIPIVGNGGVGKTTLAQIIYQDSLVCEYFDTKGWVCVSEDFDLVRLMNAILAPFSEIQCVDSDLALLRAALRQRLEGKRYLLVLDDVRNEDERLWESLTASLRIGLQGSTILVTTCSESVAKMVKTVSSYYHLEPLREQQIWSLFQTFAFGNEYLMADTKLVSIRKEISKKFEGIPLAAKMLGECLRDETSKKKWLDILLSDFWGHEDRQGAVPPALFLSYLYLPVQLKRCFSYCALFPRDNFFDKEKLIQLWMAEGFLQPTEGKRMEDMGADYFDELLRRSFLQYSPADQCRFVMHDLVHKLAEIVASEDICRLDKGSMSSVSCKARHTSFILQDSTTSVKICSSNERKGLRTFLVIHRLLNTCSVSSPLNKSRLHLRIENNIFNNLQCLRTLDLSETDIIRLPDSIDKLIHLRYLGLNHTKIQNLPESVCNLYKLQTIEMLHCRDLIKLPRGITNLRNLRHLCVFLSAISTPMPKGFGSLTNLQTLSNFCVGTDKEHCEITELKDLVNLRGELCVSGLENITNANDAKGVLKDKENIKKLILHSGVISRYTNERLDTSLFDEPSDNNEILQPSTDDFFSFVMEQKPNPEEESVFESLKPHINLKELVIRSYQGVRFPNWIADPSFYNLVSIKLDICRNCKALPPLGQLPSLQDLVIEEFSELECISPEFLSKDYFPSLRTLYFGSMYKWEDWFGEDNAAAFPCLRLLTLSFCPKLKRIPNIFFSLKKLVLWACDKLTAPPCLPSLTCLELRGHCNENIWSSMPQDLLARLQTLKINRYKDLCSFPVHQLLELKELEIYGGWPESTMPSSSLGMVFHRLVFLEKLKIQSCPGILFLPDQELPPMLQILDILHCPLLAEWCQGHGRNKLARIPRVIIDRKDFHPIDSHEGKHVD